MPGDLDLARRLLEGDELAFESFFAEYFPRLYRFARVRLGGDEDAAEEVAQTTLIKALAKVHTYRGEAALFTWLCSFAGTRLPRGSSARGKAVHLSLTDDSSDTRVDPRRHRARCRAMIRKQEYQRHELSRLVHATLDHLPRPVRRRASCGNTSRADPWRKSGDRLGLGYKAAESLLTRARHAFREAFALVAGRNLQPASVEPGRGAMTDEEDVTAQLLRLAGAPPDPTRRAYRSRSTKSVHREWHAYRRRRMMRRAAGVTLALLGVAASLADRHLDEPSRSGVGSRPAKPSLQPANAFTDSRWCITDVGARRGSQPLSISTPIHADDVIETDIASRASLQTADGSSVRIDPGVARAFHRASRDRVDRRSHISSRPPMVRVVSKSARRWEPCATWARGSRFG